MKLLLLIGFSSALADPLPLKDRLSFKYQSLSNSTALKCSHESMGFYDWEVSCLHPNGKTTKYYVHLVLSFYPKTNQGSAAYELLYWVSDVSQSPKSTGDSVTLWLYQSLKESRLNQINANLGIENDMAYLQMQVKLITSTR